MLNAPQLEVARLAIDQLDKANRPGVRYERQLLALACAFIIMCEVLKVSAQDVMTAAKNLMADPINSEGRVPQFNAVKFHLETEMLA